MPASETLAQTDAGIAFGQIPVDSGSGHFPSTEHVSPARIHQAIIESGQLVLDMPITPAEIIRNPVYHGAYLVYPERSNGHDVHKEEMPIPLNFPPVVVFRPVRSGWKPRTILSRTSGRR